MIKIGITGSTGVLGKSLIKYIKKYSKYEIIKFRGNILNKKKIEVWIKKNQFEVIIHLAALVPTNISQNNYNLAKNINLIGTKNLINAIKYYQLKKTFLFFSSTSHVYLFTKKKINEKFQTKGISKYGKTKLLAERLLLKNANFYNLCIGRISSLVSEKQSTNFIISKIMKKIKKNKKIIFENSNIKRNFIYVDDVSKIIVKIIKKKITGIVNISNSQQTHFYKFFNYLISKFNISIEHKMGKEEFLILSNKLLEKKIGKIKFLTIEKIINKFN